MHASRYSDPVIRDFGDQTTEDIFHGRNTKHARRVPREIWTVAARKLDMINKAISVRDLRAPPRNRLEMLRGELAGFYSIRVNQQYRVVFRFADTDASEVRIVDYH